MSTIGIGSNVFDKMNQLSKELINVHSERMKEAFNKSGDGKLSVSMSFSIESGKAADQYDIDAQIGYVVERVKEKVSDSVSENQIELPLGDKKVVYKMNGSGK